MRDGVHIRKGRQSLEQLAESLRILADAEVLVGFPEETADRQGDLSLGEDGKVQDSGSDITNAALAYIHDNGEPAVNIPARPFMVPAMEECEAEVTGKMSQIVAAVVKRGAGATVVEQGLHQVGLIAKLAIQNKINEGIPPPLADSTLRKRAKRGRKGAGIELLSRSQGYEPSMDFAKPLVDTARMRNAANYVLRSRKKRK